MSPQEGQAHGEASTGDGVPRGVPVDAAGHVLLVRPVPAAVRTKAATRCYQACVSWTPCTSDSLFLATARADWIAAL